MSNCTERIKTDECVKTRDESYEKCNSIRDEGYNRCTQTRDAGYSSCDDWGLFSFVCIAWQWIKNIVCVAFQWMENLVCVGWEWIVNIVCVAWKYIVKFVCVALDVITTVIGLIITLLDVILSIIGGAISAFIDLLTSIPIIGRFFEWTMNLGKEIIAFFVSVFDGALALVGIMPEKKLRLVVVIQCDEYGHPLMPDNSVALRAIQYTINTYKTEMNIRVIPLKLFQYNSAFSDYEIANDNFIFRETDTNTSDTLDVCCKECEAGQNLLSRGSAFSLKITVSSFFGGGRRLLGYGSPVVAFAVRKFTDGKRGCSLGPLTDYVTVLFTDSNDSDPKINAIDLTPDKTLGTITSLAHEITHCCNNWHKDDTTNLMNSEPPRMGHLTIWQKVLVRSSRHVTYF